jgi:hypothetical protein
LGHITPGIARAQYEIHRFNHQPVVLRRTSPRLFGLLGLDQGGTECPPRGCQLWLSDSLRLSYIFLILIQAHFLILKTRPNKFNITPI